jgi:hypothetical protein
MTRRGLVTNLYRTAGLANDISALASGNPHPARLAAAPLPGSSRAADERPLWSAAG